MKLAIASILIETPEEFGDREKRALKLAFKELLAEEGYKCLGTNIEIEGEDSK